MKKIIISLIIILVIYFILVFKYQLRVNNDYTIQQVDNPNYQIVESIIESRSPTIITGWLDNLLSLYQLNNLVNIGGNDTITIKKNIVEQEETILLDMTLKQYIDFITNKQNKINNNYYWSEDLDFLKTHSLDKPLHHFFSNYFQNTKLFSSTALWIGPNGSKTGLHYDLDHINLLCQISGKKKIYLFSPSQQQYMYISNKYDPGAKLSMVDFWNQDLHKYPLFKEAKYIEIILNPGQILVIPPYWWHCVENIDTNIAISYRLETPFSVITKLPESGKLILHKCGLYKSKNCICCNK